MNFNDYRRGSFGRIIDAAQAFWKRRREEAAEARQVRDLLMEFKKQAGDGTQSLTGEELEKTIASARRILGFFEKERGLRWAVMQSALGTALGTLGQMRGDAAILKEAIGALKAALDEFPQGWGKEWAMTQANLGSFSVRLGEINGDAIALNEAVDAFRKSQNVFTRKKAPLDWAAVQDNIGCVLARIAELQGDAKLLTAAIDAFDAALEERTHKAWGTTQSNRGSALLTLSELQGTATALDDAEDALRAALREIKREREPAEWAAINNNLGNVLARMGELRGDATMLDKAATAYRAALLERPAEKVPLEWATTQSNLGSVLATLGELRGDATALQDAVIVFQALLNEPTCKQVPMLWAATQRHLGTTLAKLADLRGDTAALDSAVAAFGGAISRYSGLSAATDLAMTINNLGTALQTLGELREDVMTLSRAAEAFRDALAVLTPDRARLDWATIQNNLGTVLARIGEIESEPTLLEDAVAAYCKALSVRTPDHTPIDWANTQNCLGSALQTLGSIRSDTGTLVNSVTVFKKALSKFTPEQTPIHWAMTQNNLGNALAKLGALRNNPTDLKDAADAYRKALTEITLTRSPANSLGISRALANTLLRSGAWQEVIDLLDPLMAAAVALAQGEGARDRQGLLLARIAGLGDALAFARLRLADPKGALLATGRGRAILLDGGLMLERVSENSVLQAARARWRMAQSAAAHEDMPLEGADVDTLALQARRRAEANTVVTDAFAKFQEALVAAGLGDPPTTEIAELALAVPAGGALVAVVVTEVGGAALILPHAASAPEELPLKDLTTSTVGDMLWQKSASGAQGWFHSFDLWRRSADEQKEEAAKAWNKIIRATTEKLGVLLMGTVNSGLHAQGVKPGSEVVLMVPGRLAVLPLHAAVIGRTSAGDDSVFLDEWVVSFTPSLNAFMTCRTRAGERATASPSLLAVTNPTGDLWEISNPALFAFRGCDQIDLKTTVATRAKVLEALPGRTHLSYYGHASWNAVVPERSELRLADAPLTVADLRGVNLSATRLAALAGCETGLVDVGRQADEFVGLPSALIEAGVPSVIASLWVVYTKPTERLMTVFFERLVAGDTPALALQAAQRVLRQSARPVPSAEAIEATDSQPSEHQGDGTILGIGSRAHSSTADTLDLTEPIYWAGFTLTGA